MRGPASLLTLVLVCCGPSAARPPEMSPEPAPTAASPAADSGAIIGSWSSPECGLRGYERFLLIEPDGTYSTEDRFEACAPGNECDGSGVAIMRGRYEYSEPAQPGPSGRSCRFDRGACLWLDSDEASREDPRTEAIARYPALLFFEDEPLESDGQGTVCRYRRVE